MGKTKMNTLKRKFRKLKNNPKLFFKDWYIKNKQIAEKYLPTIKYAQCNNSYTIVSAVYNVEKYLDDYFKSIVNQSVDFEKYIRIICIDDGSTDNSAAVIKKWQSKYPNNITYIYKENGGQASARNLGLEYVKTEWVTFPDPDDFISKNYFEKIDEQIEKDKDVVLVAANLLFYYEKDKHIKDTHPLKFKFNKTHTIKLADNVEEIQLATNSSFLKTNLILENGISFDKRVIPNFEDAKFITEYLMKNIQNKKISFVKDSVYFYRKRKDNSSTLDISWQRKEKFYDVILYGYLSLLEQVKKDYGKTPTYVQNIVLYDLVWYIKYLLNNSKKIDWLTLNEKNEFWKLFICCFKYLDKKTIMNFTLADCCFKYKVGMLGVFKGIETPFQIVYVEHVDYDKKQILLFYYYYIEHHDIIMLDDKIIVPIYKKTIYNELLSHFFCYERRYCVSFQDENQVLRVCIGNKKVKILLKDNIKGIVSYENCCIMRG